MPDFGDYRCLQFERPLDSDYFPEPREGGLEFCARTYGPGVQDIHLEPRKTEVKPKAPMEDLPTLKNC